MQNKNLEKAINYARILSKHKHFGVDWTFESVTTWNACGDIDDIKPINEENYIIGGKHRLGLHEAEKIVMSYEPSREMMIDIITHTAKHLSDGKLHDIWSIMEGDASGYIEAEELARKLAINNHKGCSAWFVEVWTTGNIWVGEEKKEEHRYLKKGDRITINSAHSSIRYDLNEARAIVKGMYEG